MFIEKSEIIILSAEESKKWDDVYNMCIRLKEECDSPEHKCMLNDIIGGMDDIFNDIAVDMPNESTPPKVWTIEDQKEELKKRLSN